MPGTIKLHMPLLGALVLSLGIVSSCADTSSVRMGGNMARIDVSAAPVYGSQGATDMALRAAAEETLSAGFTHFAVLDFGARYDSRVVGVMPGQASVSGDAGGFFGRATGPTPIVRARNERSMVIQMLGPRAGERSNAYNAAALLQGD